MPTTNKRARISTLLGNTRTMAVIAFLLAIVIWLAVSINESPVVERVLRERLVENGIETLVQFDGDDLLCPLRELDGQDTDAGADFDDAVLRTGNGRFRHAGTDTRIDQKVLSECLGKVEPILL